MTAPQIYTFVVAPNRVWFENWCRIDAEPEENPRDPKFVVFSDNRSGARKGRYVKDGDRLIILDVHAIEWDLTPVIYQLLSIGFQEYENRDGTTRPLRDLLPPPEVE